ncbi:type VI secretion system ATPase TssH [Undibacterium sp. RuRC25W]|uniref:type VI secretion system ATPase TssH n=1 Tax=Undibacterium sp. RuRC25W TaxID=3413047 RepID=UPI003BF0D96E
MTLISRRVLFGKLGLVPFRALESAAAFAKLRGNPYIETVHWLHQLWQVPNTDLHSLISYWNLDAEQFEKDLIASLAALPNGASSINDFSRFIESATERAWILASLTMADSRIRSAWLLVAMLEQTDLRKVLFSISSQFQRIVTPVNAEELSSVLRRSCENNDPPQDDSDLADATPGDASNVLLENEARQQSALSKYCTDLTALARNGKIDPVVGREYEIRTMTDILLRRRQNNPLLTGEAGVGKTAVVEGLACAIAAGKVPPPLLSVRLLSLDVGALIAGASMRGEFESRLKSVLKEADNTTQPIILFVDEIHTLVGAGGQAGTGDAANLLKPALARGNLRTIGATTWSEYKKYIEKDPALTRRFQVLQIKEPEVSQAIEMVRGLVPTFMGHHKVEILDEAVCAAVTLSHRYMPSRQLPDKAISLLDTACARVAMSLHTPPSVVAQLREQHLALCSEYALIKREVQMGHSNHGAIESIVQKKTEIETQLNEKEKQWLEELALVQKLMQRREALLADDETVKLDAENESFYRQSAFIKSHLTDNEDREQLSLAISELARFQSEDASVYAQVDESVIAAIIADWTGIPVGRMVRDEVSAVMGLAAQLEKRVVGQSAAIAQITERIKTARARLSDPNKPVGCFLLVGPSGVGKTETALALAHAVYGGEHNLIAINMSEYQEAHTVSSLKGSPPGYVGYGEGGVLTEAVRRRPYSVVLLDEIEKAHPDVHELFFQVFDKGWMEDGEGRVIDFKNTVILLTSNVGSDLIIDLCEDDGKRPSSETLVQALQDELQRLFPVAFLGRLKMIPYSPLSQSDLALIVQLALKKVVVRMLEQHDILLTYDAAAVEGIVHRCGAHNTGARHINHYIEQHLLSHLAQLWLQASQDRQPISNIHLSVQHHESDPESDVDLNLTRIDSKANLYLTTVYK